MKSVLVIGIGKVGSLVGILLKDAGFEVTGFDRAVPQRELPYPVETGDVTNKDEMKKVLSRFDAVVSCLPYDLNIDLAQVAFDIGIHYFDLTEDVPTTNFIRGLAEKSKGVMVPQCGLAPGYIGIVGSDLASQFETIRSIELRVGALPQNPKGKLGYAFNWSPEGVVNEYINDCEVIHQGKRKMVPALEGLDSIYIDGQHLEAFTTSGGLGTMCETFDGRVKELNYKTMRYPGHCDMMRFFFHELHMDERRDAAGEILINAKPPVNDDVVYFHASVEGKRRGQEWREEFVEAYYPQVINGEEWRAISWTTSASVASVVEMVRDGTLPQQGFIKQEDIPLDKFFSTVNGGLFLLDEGAEWGEEGGDGMSTANFKAA